MADGAAHIHVPQTAEQIQSVATIIRNSRGRPSEYKPEYCVLAHNLALLGKSDEQIGVALGCSYSTVQRWIEKKKDFRLALARARDIADGEVARSLFERAKGYSHPAVKIFPPKTADGDPLIIPYTEHYAPDTAAASLWLRNRQGDKWKEKTSSDVNMTMTLEAIVLQSIAGKEPLNVTPKPIALSNEGEAYDDLL